jgi:Fe-S cluster biosynthesis and repair protein YggX
MTSIMKSLLHNGKNFVNRAKIFSQLLTVAARSVNGSPIRRRASAILDRGAIKQMSCGHGGGSFNQIDNAIRPGARKVFCVKFQKEMEGLDEIPFEGHPLGQKIYDSVSKEAWKMWVEHMKMLMNEYRLNLGTAQAQEFLLQQMDNYFFGEGAQLPPDFVPPKSKG